MILTIARVAATNVRRDRVALAMTFVLPVAFFSIFALVFGQQSRRETRPIRVAVVDDDRSDASRRLMDALRKEPGLQIVESAAPGGAASSAAHVPLDRARAEALVREGAVPIAVVVPAGFAAAFGTFGEPGARVALLADVSDPIAPPMVEGLLQKAGMNAAPDLLARGGLAQFERYGGAFTPQQRQAVDELMARLNPSAPPAGEAKDRDAKDGNAKEAGPVMGGLIAVEKVDVLGEGKSDSLVSFYAAGVAVMFLLFSCTAAAGSLLEEVESGTLERLLTSNLGMGRLLLGKWVFLVGLGVAQITVMFVWGALVFHVDLWSHLAGFTAMTFVTAAAAGGFGLVLATLCRTRAQLSGTATIVILMMSAVGGSMFPRFLMSETMQKIGLFTFNGWALDGFIKVFWRNATVLELWPQLAVLSALAAVFLGTARLLARRWETA
jgi:ABC-2 type transport system permease protein